MEKYFILSFYCYNICVNKKWAESSLQNLVSLKFWAVTVASPGSGLVLQSQREGPVGGIYTFSWRM